MGTALAFFLFYEGSNLFFAYNHIRQTSNEPILLHVAKWNDKAFMLYKKVGFVLTNTVRVR